MCTWFRGLCAVYMDIHGAGQRNDELLSFQNAEQRAKAVTTCRREHQKTTPEEAFTSSTTWNSQPHGESSELFTLWLCRSFLRPLPWGGLTALASLPDPLHVFSMHLAFFLCMCPVIFWVQWLAGEASKSEEFVVHIASQGNLLKTTINLASIAC